MAVLAPTAALADGESVTDDVDTSESTTTEPTPEVTDSTLPTAPAEESVDTDEPETETEADESDERIGDQVDVVEEQKDVRALDDAADEDEVIVPDTGLGKFSQPIRIGVDLAEGTYVPAGVTTAGSVLQITETGPGIEGGSVTTECTTEAGTAEGTATFCVFDEAAPVPLRVPDGELSLFSVVFPENADPEQDDQVYLAARDSTVTVTQIGVAPGLVGDPESATVSPCPQPITEECFRQVALLEDTGLPPVAADDRATTREDTPVTIDVLANDDTVAGAPLTGFDFASAPANGSVEIVGTDAAPQVRYTPEDGFAGTDTFSYGLSTPNGVAFADVTVVVEPDAEPAASHGLAPAAVSGMPDAGGPAWPMFAWAAALLAAGAGVLTYGRRRAAR